MNTLLIVIVLIFLSAIYFYNKLIRRKNEVENATGSINAMLKNRYDLIPNLIDTVKSYMSYESEMLNQLTATRTKALSDNTPADEKLELNSKISGALKQVMVAVENYPNLKASNNFMQLQESWADIEDRIAASRRFYNNAVTDYNNAISTFPGNILAGIVGYQSKAVFEVTGVESGTPTVKQLFNN